MSTDAEILLTRASCLPRGLTHFLCLVGSRTICGVRLFNTRTCFWAPGTEFSGRINAFCRAEQPQTPVDSSECSPGLSESFLFLQSHSLIFGAANRFSLGGEKKGCMWDHKDFWWKIEKSRCPQNWQYYGQTVKLRVWKNVKVLKEALGKLRGASISRSLPAFSTVPSSKSPIFDKTTQFLRASPKPLITVDVMG